MIIQHKDLLNIRKKHENKNIAICTGTFDLFHYSHLMFLKYIKENSDILIVVVKSDKDVREKGKNRPIINEYERATIVDNIKYTDYTIISNDICESDLIRKLIKDNNYVEKDIYKLKRDGYIFEKLEPDNLYVTEDKNIAVSLLDMCKEKNININIIPVQGINFHTTDIINKIIETSK